MLALCLPMLLGAQSFVDRYAEAYNFYVKQDFYIKYRLYAIEDVRKPESLIGSGVMIKSGKDYYTMYGQDETYISNHTMVNVDHEKKIVSYMPNYTLNNIHSINRSMIDSAMFRNVDSVVYKGVISDCSVYRVYGYSEDYEMLDIWMRLDNHAVSKLVYLNTDAKARENGLYKRITVQYDFEDASQNGKYIDLKNVFADEAKKKLVARLSGYRLSIIKQYKKH